MIREQSVYAMSCTNHQNFGGRDIEIGDIFKIKRTCLTRRGVYYQFVGFGATELFHESYFQIVTENEYFEIHSALEIFDRS